ncbi:hypothetical protein CR969_00940 [Candidatus Saccharibacteria bacterium]|nr:MAG: hypothetical protein CR969_00940 [Candidatus Saccharibacteria bacterium]
MKEVLFLRHGESEANRLGICAGHADFDLTDKGIKQAESVGEELLDAGKKIDFIVSSPLRRALHTAAIVADILESGVVVNADAVERFRGDFECRPSLDQHGMTDADYIKHGAESEASMLERAERLLGWIDRLDVDSCLVVSHNQFGRTLLAHAWGVERDNIDKLPNAKVIAVNPRMDDYGRIN